jgi:hypothetical protein
MPFYRTSAADAVFQSPMLLRLVTAGALAASLGPAAAVAAAQPNIEPLAPCYVAAQPNQTQPVSITAHGFMPYAPVNVSVNGVPEAPGPGIPQPQADANGDVTGSVPAPYFPFGVHPFTLTVADARDPNGPGASASASSFVTLLAVRQVPQQARTGARVRFKGRGFTAPGAVYAHYVYKGVSHKTVRLALPKGACGAFSRKIRQFPFRARPKVGLWTIQFDQQPHYSATAPVFVRLPIRVSRTIRGR